MKTSFFTICVIALLVVAVTSDVNAQAFPNDNDGLLDVGEAPGFPIYPPGATGDLVLDGRGIEDLDGTSLLTNLQGLYLGFNEITNIESGDFDGLANLLELNLGRNEITSIESGDFEGLSNLQELGLNSNPITSIEANAFAGLTSLETLDLGGNGLTELNLSGATFEKLQPFFFVNFGDVFLRGLRIDDSIMSLVLDSAELSQSSFDALVRAIDEQTNLVDVSLVKMAFTDEYPSDLSALTGISTLDNVRVDPSLFSLYAAEFDTFAAILGNSVTIVPEPKAVSLVLAAFMGVVAYKVR